MPILLPVLYPGIATTKNLHIAISTFWKKKKKYDKPHNCDADYYDHFS